MRHPKENVNDLSGSSGALGHKMGSSGAALAS